MLSHYFTLCEEIWNVNLPTNRGRRRYREGKRGREKRKTGRKRK